MKSKSSLPGPSSPYMSDKVKHKNGAFVSAKSHPEPDEDDKKGKMKGKSDHDADNKKKPFPKGKKSLPKKPAMKKKGKK